MNSKKVALLIVFSLIIVSNTFAVDYLTGKITGVSVISKDISSSLPVFTTGAGTPLSCDYVVISTAVKGSYCSSANCAVALDSPLGKSVLAWALMAKENQTDVSIMVEPADIVLKMTLPTETIYFHKYLKN